jgi:hypothetical protein
MVFGAMMARRAIGHPARMAWIVAAAVVLPLAWFVFYGLAHAAGTSGVVAVPVGGVLVVAARAQRARAARIRAGRAFLARYHPRVHYAVWSQMSSLDVVVAPYLAAGLPPLRPQGTAMDPGVWHPAYVGAAGDAAVRVGLPRGLRLDHLRTAAPTLAAHFRVAAVTADYDHGTRTAAVLTLYA